MKVGVIIILSDLQVVCPLYWAHGDLHQRWCHARLCWTLLRFCEFSCTLVHWILPSSFILLSSPFVPSSFLVFLPSRLSLVPSSSFPPGSLCLPSLLPPYLSPPPIIWLHRKMIWPLEDQQSKCTQLSISIMHTHTHYYVHMICTYMYHLSLPHISLPHTSLTFTPSPIYPSPILPPPHISHSHSLPPHPLRYWRLSPLKVEGSSWDSGVQQASDEYGQRMVSTRQTGHQGAVQAQWVLMSG